MTGKYRFQLPQTATFNEHKAREGERVIIATDIVGLENVTILNGTLDDLVAGCRRATTEVAGVYNLNCTVVK